MFAWWGRAVVRLRWLLLVAAAAVVVAGATWGSGVFGDLINGGFEDPSSSSSKAQAQITAQLGRQDPDIIALYTGDQLEAPVRQVMARIKDRPEVSAVVNGRVSTDGKSTYLAIQLRDGSETAKLADLETLTPLLKAEGAETELGGLIPFLHDANKQISSDITKAEIISLPILLLLLIFIFRGLVAALTPLLVGILAVLGAFITVRALAQVTDVSVFAINIITMLGLGMAIDYSLFIVSRFREELARGKTPAEAIRMTIATAGRTVVVSGLTVALALASLLVFPMAFLKSMAWGGMSAVLVAMVAALTVLPALLVVLGPRINALSLKRAASTGGAWAGIAKTVMRRPVIYAVGVTALLLALAIPFAKIQFGGFDERVLPKDTPSRVVSERLNDGFPGGGSYPIKVLTTGPAASLAADIEKLDYVTGTMVVQDKLILVTFPGEATSVEARDLVKEIRGLPGDHLVGGRSAADVDQLDAFQHRLPWMLALIAVSTFVLLFLAFGSVVLPLKAILMNVISIGASFGVVVWVFQEGHFADWMGFTVTGFLEPGNLVLMLAILFGLATDYEVFLLSRVREEWDATGDNTTAVARGLQRTGGIITAAALLLIIVIGGFATGGTATIKLLGVGTVVAVAVDAALVRTLLVPATMRLLGKWNWWAPGPLSRIYRRYGIKESDSPAPVQDRQYEKVLQG